MKLAVVIRLCAVLVIECVHAEAETIPRTYDESGEAFRDAGHELSDGFRGVGRGVKDTFTGQRSGDDYRKGKAIGTGFKDIGRGIAGGARATGRGIKRAFQGGHEKPD